jgi:RND superfamily putative drug exporter
LPWDNGACPVQMDRSRDTAADAVTPLPPAMPEPSRETARPSRTIAAAIVRHRRVIACAWALAFVGLAPIARRVNESLAVAGNRTGFSQAAEVEQRMAADFASPYARYAILIITGLPSPISPAGLAALSEVRATVTRTPGVSRTVSYLTSHDTAFVGAQGTFMIVGLTTPRAPADDWIVGLRTGTTALQRQMRARFPQASFAWTGNAALNYDVRSATAADASRAEHRIVPVILVLLLAVFGSIVAASLPLLAAVVSIVMSLGCVVLLVHAHWPLSIVLRNAVSMLGLGAGIDYALLIVNRFREGLAAGRTPERAAEYALEHAGHTVVLSAAAVVISFSALLSVRENELRSIATGGLLVVGISALLATTLLPGLLAWLGSRVNAARIHVFRRRRRGAPRRRRYHAWRAWGRWAAAHPWPLLAFGGFPLLLLGAQSRRLDANLPSGDWLPRHAESASAIRTLTTMGKSGLVQSLRVLLVLPHGAGPLTQSGWDATMRLTAEIAHDARVATVRSLPSVTHAVHPSATLLTMMPPDLLRTFVSRTDQETVLEVVPRESASISAIVNLARDIRLSDVGRLTGVAGTRVLVGGLPAFNAEYQDEVQERMPSIVGVVVLGSFLALLIGFRSVLVPIKAVILNLLTVAAAFGAAVIVFQDGWGVRLLGLERPIDGLFPAVPLVVFCLVFGFSMDYEVFLVSRVAEAARRGADPQTAVAHGLARTGGVITSAALIMVVVFAAFALSEFLLVKVLGFTLAVAIVLDATIVRMAVGPALLRLAGRWNWWPGVRRRPAAHTDAFDVSGAPSPIVK